MFRQEDSMNKIKSILIIASLIIYFPFLQVTAQMGNFQQPFQPGMGGLPKLSEADLKAMEELDKILSSMEPEEVDEILKLAEELERAVQAGEININDLLPPGMQMPPQQQKPTQPQKPPEEKVEEAKPAPTCVVEKQVALRNKNL